MKNNIPLEILPYLEEISERLWANHASVMIGAGFSKNAKKGESMNKQSPSWNELGDCFYRKVYGKTPDDKDKSYMDVLKLAEEVEATYGRSTLDNLLKSEIPDKELQPSDLHAKLLSLPWTDVFTTNYDSLLERAASTVLGQRYETIVNKEDLIWSSKPRIIKLHGSFPSIRPFIITEEDYRKYPKEFAPFVNTVQQSLLENSLCLIGFSGEDPNFQKWIGWIRDNLGKNNSPKIYLIGLLSLSVGQKRLLEERNIVPVDLSCWRNNDKSNHYEVLMTFIDYLLKQKETVDKLKWIKRESLPRFDLNEDITSQVKKITNIWKEVRLNYPNWIILPREKRNTLRDITENHYPIIYHLDKVDTPIDIKFLYEMNWRIEKYLMPIFNDWVKFYENVLEKYNPYPDRIKTETNVLSPISFEGKKISEWNIISRYWLELKLSLLRLYREEGFIDKWQSLFSKLESVYDNMPPELVARFHYERCLFSLFQLDITSLRKELELWRGNTSLPYWEAKKAMLLAELGDLNEAERILELSLVEVRNQLYLYPSIADYLLVSQESYILQLLRYVKQTLNNRNYNFNNSNDEYNDRWNQLKQYGCDPWGELQLFDAHMLDGNSSSYKMEEKSYGFEIGKSTITRRNGYNKIVQEAYGFLRYIEEVGISLKLPGITFGKNVAQKAIIALSSYSSFWTYVTLIRTGQEEIINSVFDRKSMSFMSQKYVESIALNYLNFFEKSFDNHFINNSGDDIFSVSITNVIPKILSRLCFKCTYETRLQMLNVIKKLTEYDSIQYNNIEGFKFSLVKSFSQEEQWNLIPDFLLFPIVSFTRNKQDLFDYIEITNHEKYNPIKLKANIVANLLADLIDFEGKREIAIKRLYFLYKYGLLNKNQKGLFAKKLWMKVDEKQFPIGIDYFIPLYFYPHPSKINPEAILRSYINSEPFRIQKKEKNNGISITRGNIPILISIVNIGEGADTYDWTKEEINNLVVRIKEWWDNDKDYLKQTEINFIDSIASEFKFRFRYLIKIISFIIRPHITKVDKANILLLESIIDDLHNYEFPDLEAKASLISLYPNDINEMVKKIKVMLCSRNPEYIVDAIQASIILIKNNSNDVSSLILSISEIIKYRTEIGLYLFVDGLIIILKETPEHVNSNILNNLEIGLSLLVEENKVLYDDSQEVVHKKLLIRQRIAKLIPLLQSFYEGQKKIQPQYIFDWIKILSNEDEFLDLKNCISN